MRQPVPRFPEVPPLTEAQVAAITRIVFLDEPGEPEPCDLIFVFGGTHPALWRTAAEAYRRGLGPRILVTGGVNPEREHQRTNPGDTPEAHVLARNLIDAGVPEDRVIIEDRSSNTLENVLFAKDVFDFGAIASLLLVCKSYAAGRQHRTLRRHLPARLRIVAYPFDTTNSKGKLITRSGWMETPENRSRVFGEYLRILAYGEMGSITPLERPVEGLEEYLASG